MALALLTSISIPPNVFTASCTALVTAPSSRMSTAQGRHFPPTSSTIYKHKNLNHHYSTVLFSPYKTILVKLHVYLEKIHDMDQIMSFAGKYYIQRSKLTFSKSHLLVNFNYKMVAPKKIQ